MVQPRFASGLASALVLVGGSLFAYAQMAPNDDRVIPYQGRLEASGGVAATGAYDMRFALFTATGANADCLLSDPTTCALWGEQQTVDVTEGNFSVVLGDSTSLTDTILGQPALFLAIAVAGPNDAGVFSLLGQGSKQELLPVPFASRAAAARDYKVVGTLTADVVTTNVANATTLNATAANFSTAGADVRLESSSAGGLDLRALANPADGQPIFRVLSEGFAERLRVEHNGATAITNDLSVSGNADITGSLKFSCETGWSQVGGWCIENNRRGGGGATYESAMSACHGLAAMVCPIGALMACDTLSPAGATCRDTTDTDQWLWTSHSVGNDVNAYDNVNVYNGLGNNSSNEIDVTASTETTVAGTGIGYFCCRNAGGN